MQATQDFQNNAIATHSRTNDVHRRVRSHDLLRGERRIKIDHGDTSYTLLLTRNDKLILVK